MAALQQLFLGYATGGGLLLDTLSASASSAYSTRKLRTAYAGSAIRVRRSSDNTQSDIGFDGSGNLDTTALAAFVGANSAYITKWYDQSGNARDATQATTGLQPRIVNAGTNDTKGGHPAIRFAIASAGVISQDLPAYLFAAPSTDFSLSTVSSADTAGTSHVYGSDTDSPFQASGLYLQFASGPSLDAVFNRSGAATVVSKSGGTAGSLFAGLVTHTSGNVATVYIANAAGTPSSAMTWTAGTWSNFHIGRFAATHPASLTGYVGEHISFTSVLGSTDRSTLYSSQSAYWGV